jgi:hypothetical protein
MKLKQRLSTDGWTGNAPFVVAAVAAIGGLFALRGMNGYASGVSGVPAYLDPLYYLGTLFAHSGPSHYVSVMYFFVPAGVLLTYLTNNRMVAYAVVVSHLPTAAVCSVLGVGTLGAGAAAYGLLAAVLVRAAWLSSKGYSRRARVASVVGVFGLTGLGLVAVTGAAAAVYVVPVSGFLLGGTYEVTRVLRGHRGGKGDTEEATPAGGYDGTTHLGSPWEKTGGEDDSSDGGTVPPDDTYAGSGGRTRSG